MRGYEARPSGEVKEEQGEETPTSKDANFLSHYSPMGV